MKKIISIMLVGIICISISTIIFNYAENGYEESELMRIEFNEILNETENRVIMLNSTTNATMYLYRIGNGVRITSIEYPEHIYDNEEMDLIITIKNSGQSKFIVIDCVLSGRSPMDFHNASWPLGTNEVLLEENSTAKVIVSCDSPIGIGILNAYGDRNYTSYGDNKFGIFLTSESIDPEDVGTIIYCAVGAIPLEIRDSENFENMNKLSIALFVIGITLILLSLAWYGYRHKKNKLKEEITKLEEKEDVISLK